MNQICPRCYPRRNIIDMGDSNSIDLDALNMARPAKIPKVSYPLLQKIAILPPVPNDVSHDDDNVDMQSVNPSIHSSNLSFNDSSSLPLLPFSIHSSDNHSLIDILPSLPSSVSLSNHLLSLLPPCIPISPDQNINMSPDYTPTSPNTVHQEYFYRNLFEFF